jgi:hypothetical protein
MKLECLNFFRRYDTRFEGEHSGNRKRAAIGGKI